MQSVLRKWLSPARTGTEATPDHHLLNANRNIRELIELTDYPSFDIEGVNRTFEQWEHDKEADIMGYRNQSYRSLMTGTMSPPRLATM